MAATAALSERIGVTRLANLTGLDRIGYPVVAAIRPMSRNLTVSMGKGDTIAHAEMSALMEAAELNFSEAPAVPSRFAAFDDMPPGTALDPSRLAEPHSGPLGALLLQWVEGRYIDSGHPVWVPWPAISMDFTEEALKQPCVFRSSGTGLAADTSRASAVLHGLLEVVEREAHVHWNELENAARFKTLVDPDRVEDERTRALLARIQAAALHVFIWDLTCRDGLPCYMVEIVDFAAHATTPFAQGAAAHINAGLALHKALAEALQVRLTYISGSRDDLGWDEYDGRFAAVVENRRGIAIRHQGRHPSVAGIDSSGDPGGAISTILLKLGDAATSALAVDLTPPDAEMAAVKVMIPSARDTPDSNHYHLQRIMGRA
ncbi:YcaO-like family protein [Aestuariivirga sp.]|uniref:YcaO-like family protein n=1 Tax=Aestuariivirga sp. TaxID=2650926 RepID=UPI0039E60F53